MTGTTSIERRDRELREFVEQIVVMAEAAVTLAWDKGYRAAEHDVRTPLTRRVEAQRCPSS